MWIIFFTVISFGQLNENIVKHNPDVIPCRFDVDCGYGDCWIGTCEMGACVGHHTCV